VVILHRIQTGRLGDKDKDILEFSYGIPLNVFYLDKPKPSKWQVDVVDLHAYLPDDDAVIFSPGGVHTFRTNVGFECTSNVSSYMVVPSQDLYERSKCAFLSHRTIPLSDHSHNVAIAITLKNASDIKVIICNGDLLGHLILPEIRRDVDCDTLSL